MKHLKNITRFTYEFTSFQGWRVTICRKNVHFTRYFSDKQYGSEEAALEAATTVRDAIIEALKKNPLNPESVFKNYSKESPTKNYPVGVRPRKRGSASA